MPEPMGLGRLSLRERERGFLAGGSQTGKSTLADALGDDFIIRYRDRGARRLILDTKPRYRAEWLPNGMSAKRLYKKWDHGPVMRDSVLVRTPADMNAAFSMGHQTAIASASSSSEIPRLVHLCAAFLEGSRRNRPQLLQVDETCDFFYGNGMPRGSDDAIVRVSRAGAERGTASLYCSQRTKGISPHLMEHMQRLYAFMLDVAGDAKRFAEFGAPIGPDDLPTREHIFYYWTKKDRRHVWGPYQLDIRGRGVA